MAKRKSRKARKMQPAVTTISLKTTPAVAGINHQWFVDTSKELSKVNRRLYEQGRMYAYQGLTFIWKQDAANPVSALEVKVLTAGNTWVVQNAFVKGKALWNEMNQLVLEDNPSIRGKWQDFKVQLSDDQSSVRTLGALDADGAAYTAGEWDLSTYVMPQHVVDPVTGQPLAADEFTAVLIGADTGSKRSLVKAYEESRATVQPTDPNVPAGMSTSFFNLLTDSGSQEPELADVIEDDNDEPPYATNDYPQGDSNAPTAVIVGYGAISASEVDGSIAGFVAPCGLVEIQIRGFGPTGVEITSANLPAIEMLLHVAPGTYKGVMSVPMGQ